MRNFGRLPAMRSLYPLLVATVLYAAPPLFTATLSAADSSPADCAQLSGQAIRWILPSKPGGAFDAYSRLLQPFLEQRLAARLVIDNRPEAGGIAAALAIRDARPDGRTIGIVNAPGLLTAQMIGNDSVPDPTADFTTLGRVVASDYVLFTGHDSGFSSIEALLQSADDAPILVGVRDAGSSSFLMVPLTTSLIGLNTALVTGYVGNAARTLAAMRGEVDIVIHSVDSARRYVAAGELIPLLQITGPTNGYDLGIPVLGGPDGVARQRAAATGRTAEQAVREAKALADIIGSGRLVVAPSGLPEPLAACLGSALIDALRSDELLAAARRAALNIAPADRNTARKDLLAAARQLAEFQPLLAAAIEQLRQ